MCNVGRQTMRPASVLAALLSLSFCAWGQISSCDLNGDGVVDSADVALAVNMALGTASCTANIEGPSTCTLVTVQRVTKASQGRGCVVYNSSSITSPTTASAIVGTPFSYQITAGNSPTSYSATGLPAGLSVNTASGLISGTPVSGGTSTVTLGVINSAGARNATLTLNIADAPPTINDATSAVRPSISEAHRNVPVITSATSASGTVGSAFSYQITATNSPTSYSATGLPAGLSVNTATGLISGTPTSAGTSTVTLRATNGSAGSVKGGGTGSATLTLTIAPAGAPAITSATSASGTVGSAFSYQITATNSPTSYSATGLPAGLSVNSATGLISGTPTSGGVSTVTLGATNAGGTGHATLTLTIAATAPVITSATSASGTVGSAFSYQITATNSATSYSATGLPAGLSINTATGLISGTPTSAGTSTVTLGATNTSGPGNATLTLTVTAAHPVITSATSANGAVGSAFSYQITATNSPTGYGATGLPAGLSVNTATGLISGTPTSAGTSTVTLGATNAGGTGHATLTLTIAAAAPAITSATSASGTVGSAFSYQITATNSPTSYSATGLPAGLSVNTATGLISGTPTSAGTSTVTLGATNAGGTGTAALTLTIAPVITSAMCTQNLAIGNYTLCGEAYNDVASGSSVTVNYSPSAGNGIIAWATWCFNSTCNSSSSGITATIGDNVNATESCFVASPHSPFITDGNGGAQGSGDFQQFYVWYCPSIPSGVTSFTLTPSSSSFVYLQIHVSEWKAGGLSASCSPVTACFENVDNDGQAGNTTGGMTATLSTSGATVNANDLILAVTQVPCCTYTGSTGAGYTGITVAPGNNPGMVVEAKSVSSTGVQTATTTWTGGNAAWFGVIVPILAANATPVAPPAITSATSASGTVGSAFSYQITATNSPTSYSATGLPAGLSVNTTTGLISGTATAAGASTVPLGATNSGGTGNATLTLTVTAAHPVITSATSASGTVGSAFSYQITATNSPTSYSAAGLPAGLSVNTATGLISGTPTSAATSTVTPRATNSAGTGSATLTLSITAAHPVITSATSAGGTVGSAFSYQITATNSATSYSATGLPAGLSVNTSTGLISGTPTSAGTSTVTLGATNSGGTGDATLTLTITAAAPVITSATSAGGTVGIAFSYQITVTNSPTSYSATGLPAGLSLNTATGLISGTPTAAGTSTVTLGATNAGGTGHATLTLTVSAAVSHSVTLSWVASTSPNIAGYNIYRGTTSLSGPYGATPVNPSLITTLSYVDTSVGAGTTYYYVATAVNTSGVQSGDSTPIAATVP